MSQHYLQSASFVAVDHIYVYSDLSCIGSDHDEDTNTDDKQNCVNVENGRTMVFQHCCD